MLEAGSEVRSEPGRAMIGRARMEKTGLGKEKKARHDEHGRLLPKEILEVERRGKDSMEYQCLNLQRPSGERAAREKKKPTGTSTDNKLRTRVQSCNRPANLCAFLCLFCMRKFCLLKIFCSMHMVRVEKHSIFLRQRETRERRRRQCGRMTVG